MGAMMLAWALLVALPANDPALDLAREVAHAIGATTQTVALAPDGSVTPEEVNAFGSALVATGLFSLVEARRADGILPVRREGGDLVVTAKRPTGELSTLRVSWPATIAAYPPEPAPVVPMPPPTTTVQPDPTPPVASPPPPPEQTELYNREMEYRRLRLEVRPVLHGLYPGPAGYPVPHYGYESTPWMGRGWALGDAPPVPQAVARAGFVIARGDGAMVTEEELAELTHDPDLERELHARKRDRQLTWAFGFGAAAAGGVGAGALLLGSEGTAGGILLGVGVACGIAALLAHNAGGTPALKEREAIQVVDRYNRHLRESLGLGPEAPAEAPP